MEHLTNLYQRQIDLVNLYLVDREANLLYASVQGVSIRLEEILIPAQTAVAQNYPNPFNPETWIPFSLSEDANVQIHIYNLSGDRIRQLDLGYRPPGMYWSRDRTAHWDGRNEYGEPVASGTYFYTIRAGNFTATRKMLLTK